jgi:hypothetical protein
MATNRRPYFEVNTISIRHSIVTEPNIKLSLIPVIFFVVNVKLSQAYSFYLILLQFFCLIPGNPLLIVV